MWSVVVISFSLLLGISEALPSCITRDTGCAFNQDVIDTQFKVDHWEKCRDLCVNFGQEGCGHFVWYGPNSALFTQTCVLFKKGCPSEEVTCTGCISGPPHCDTCGIEWACQTTGDNILEMIPGILDEQSCQTSCHDSTECAFYSHYGSTHELLPNMCFLFSDCAIFKECQESSSDDVTCHTGPKECRPDQPCKKTEALVYHGAYSRTPGTKAIIENSDEQVEVLTMGCQADLTIMGVGGGAASGYYTGTPRYRGGGGSGYVNLTTNIQIPYSSSLNVNVGRGGSMRGTARGGATLVKFEDGTLLVNATGGWASSVRGGNGYSGGGAGAHTGGKGARGGSNGENGTDSENYSGGYGTLQDVAIEFDPEFQQFKLVAGSGGFYTDDYGGGGGGIEVANEKSTETTRKHSRGTRGGGYGAGGSYSAGSNGVVLIEVVPTADNE